MGMTWLGRRRWGVVCAGHSLGGALAILAAYEVAKRFPQASLRCYTYGEQGSRSSARPEARLASCKHGREVPRARHMLC